jgi:hypothetical protein
MVIRGTDGGDYRQNHFRRFDVVPILRAFSVCAVFVDYRHAAAQKK